MSGYDKKLIAVWNNDWNDFWNNKEAYRLRQRNDFYNSPLWSNAMWWSGNKLFIPAYNWIYTYWFENPNMPSALVKEYVLPAHNISATANSWWVLYMAYADTITWYSTIGFTRTYQNSVTSWYLVTNPLLRDNFSTKKQLENFKIWYIIPEAAWSIDIYISANNNYFRTFYVSWLTALPTAWAIYTTDTNTYEVISSTSTRIYCKSVSVIKQTLLYNWTLTKTSGTGDASITIIDNDNFIKVKTITADKYTQWYELIFSNDFIITHMPYWHTIQFKIQLNSTTDTGSPEIFDMPILSLPVW